MKLKRVIVTVTIDMKPDTYATWERLAEIHGLTMNEYLEYVIDDACKRGWVVSELKSK